MGVVQVKMRIHERHPELIYRYVTQVISIK